MNIRELLIRIGVSGIDNSNQKVTTLDKNVEKLKSSFDSLGGVISGALGLVSLGAIIHAADEMQTLEFRVKQMHTTVGDSAAAFDEVGKHATDSRVSIEAYVEAFAGIGAATHELITEQSDLLNVTDAVAKGLQLAGANTQQTTSVMSQLTQAVAIGKLQWEDMKVIMQNSDAFAVRLAKSMGMTLNEMVKATQGKGGGIGADKIIDALRNMHDEVNATFKTMPLTVGQGLTIVTNRFDQFVHKFNRSSGAITFLANTVITAFDKVEAALDFVTDALGGTTNAVKILGAVLGAAGLVGGVRLLAGAISLLFSPIALMIAGMAALYLIGEDVSKWLDGQPSLFGDLVGPVSDYADEIESASVALRDMRDIAVGTLRALKELGEFLNDVQDWPEKSPMGNFLMNEVGTKNVGPWLKEQMSWLSKDLGQWASWGNSATYGAFDLPQMWGDSMRGLRGSNSDNALYNQGKNGFKGNYSDMNLPLTDATAGGRTSNSFQVTISNITVEGGGSADEVRQGATQGVYEALNAPVGYNGSTLGDQLNFASGGK